MMKNSKFSTVLGIAVLLAALSASTFGQVISTDPAFDRYVDPALVQQALKTMDTNLLTDVAIQLTEGESILHRTHNTFSADQMMQLAIKVASSRGDQNALQRLARAAQRYGKTELAQELRGKVDSAPETAKNYPFHQMMGQTENGEDVHHAHSLIRSAEHAHLLGNREMLQQVNNSLPHNNDIQPETRKKLSGFFGDLINHMAPSTQNDDEEEQEERAARRPAPAPQPQNEPHRANLPGGGPMTAMTVDPGLDSGPRVYSHKLRAQFTQIKGRGFQIVKMWSSSPLNGFLNEGDIITRMDERPVRYANELDNHVSHTRIEYISNRSGNVREKSIYIP